MNFIQTAKIQTLIDDDDKSPAGASRKCLGHQLPSCHGGPPVVLTENKWSGKFVQAQKSQRITCFYLNGILFSLQNSTLVCLQRKRGPVGPVLLRHHAPAATHPSRHPYDRAPNSWQFCSHLACSTVVPPLSLNGLGVCAWTL